MHDELESLRVEVAQLRTALSRRPVIDMAKGAVMAIARCDEDTAFKHLSEVSQRHNVKLFELASALIADLGDAPEADVSGDPARQVVRERWTRA